MGAVETNFEVTPRIATWANDSFDAFLQFHTVPSFERWIVRPMDVLAVGTNVLFSSPPLTAYSVATVAVCLPDDIEEIAKPLPLKVVKSGQAKLKAGALPEVEWDL